MTSSETTRIEIDERIREQAALLQAANEATAYLLGQLKGFRPPAAIRWRFSPLDPNSIELSMTDAEDFHGFVATRVVPLRDMSDPVERDVWTLRTCRGLLEERSRLNVAKIDRLIRTIDWDQFSLPEEGSAATAEQQLQP